MDLTYVTSNYGKYISVKEYFEKENINIKFQNLDLEEPNINDIKYISKHKAKKAYDIVKKPVFVADTGFYIEDYPDNPGYPGAFVKRSGISTDINKLLDIMKNVKNRNCYFIDCLTFYDGNNYFQFYGMSKGTLSYEKRGEDLKKAKSNLWYVFIPSNSNKTLAEMTDYERKHRNDNSTSATVEFIKWYKVNYLLDELRKNNEKEKMDNFIKKYIKGQEIRDEETNKLISNSEYMLWLENFTNNINKFCDDDWIYFPNELPEKDRENVYRFNLLFHALEKYVDDNSDSYVDLVYERYYLLKYNNIGYKIGISNVQGSRYFCIRETEIDLGNYIDFCELKNNIKPKQKVLNK